MDMFEPLVPAYVAGGARVSLGEEATTYDAAAAELEAFARPLWGIVPLAAGGESFAHWDLLREGLTRGTDPRDPQYWGAIGDSDQRMDEVAPSVWPWRWSPSSSLIRSGRTVPLLCGNLDPGTHVLACVAGAVEAPDDITEDGLPGIPDKAWQTLRWRTGETLRPRTA